MSFKYSRHDASLQRGEATAALDERTPSGERAQLKRALRGTSYAEGRSMLTPQDVQFEKVVQSSPSDSEVQSDAEIITYLQNQGITGTEGNVAFKLTEVRKKMKSDGYSYMRAYKFLQWNESTSGGKLYRSLATQLKAKSEEIDDARLSIHAPVITTVTGTAVKDVGWESVIPTLQALLASKNSGKQTGSPQGFVKSLWTNGKQGKLPAQMQLALLRWANGDMDGKDKLLSKARNIDPGSPQWESFDSHVREEHTEALKLTDEKAQYAYFIKEMKKLYTATDRTIQHIADEAKKEVMIFHTKGLWNALALEIGKKARVVFSYYNSIEAQGILLKLGLLHGKKKAGVK